MYCPAVSLGRASENREFPLREGGVLSDSTSLTSFSKLGDYAGRFNNNNLARMNNPSPNLTNVCLDTPLVGPTPEPLDCAPLPVCLGKPHRYPLIIVRREDRKSVVR